MNNFLSCFQMLTSSLTWPNMGAVIIFHGCLHLILYRVLKSYFKVKTSKVLGQKWLSQALCCFQVKLPSNLLIRLSKVL